MTYNIKNARYNRLGSIDLDYEHPLYGWIPFTANPADIEPLGGELYALARDMGGVAPYSEPVLTDEERRALMPSLTSRQFWMGAASINLSKADIVSTVEAGMADTLDRKVLIAEITEASTFDRTNPSVADVMALVGLPDDQLDTLWTWASGL